MFRNSSGESSSPPESKFGTVNSYNHEHLNILQIAGHLSDKQLSTYLVKHHWKVSLSTLVYLHFSPLCIGLIHTGPYKKQQDSMGICKLHT